MIDFATITWADLKGPGVLVLLILAVLELLKRAKWIRGTRAIYLTGFLLAQVVAQVAFWRDCSEWTAHVAADAALVGFLSAILALGGHTMVQKWQSARPPPDPSS